MLVVLLSSYVLWFILPRGTGFHGDILCNLQGYGATGNYLTFLNWPRFTWIDIHNWASLALLLIIIIHMILNWNWILQTTKKLKSHLSITSKKIAEQYITSIIFLLLFLFETFSGLILWIILPRGAADYYYMTSNIGRTFLGLQRNIWLDIHAWIAVIIASIIIIHLILNWKWILYTSKKLFRRKNI
jgi:cytochrome b561